MTTINASLLVAVVTGMAWMPSVMMAEDGTTQRVVINVLSDIISMGIGPNNAVADGTTNSTEPIQLAINYLAVREGGIVSVPAGNYMIGGLTLVDGVELVGDGPDLTVFRPPSNGPMIYLNGGGIMNMTLYGTPAAGSGDNWIVGTNGVGSGGTAKAFSCISATSTINGATIDNVHASEVRYDPLYVSNCKNLVVKNSRFDRAGRNIVTLAGDTDGFIFENCYFGSLWGLYHFDIEPNDGKYVRNGLIDNCVFDGTNAGDMNTDTWGAFLGFCGDRTGEVWDSRNITVKNCQFKKIWVRAQNVYPEVSFIGNHFDNYREAFIRVSTPVGEFRNAVVLSNTFVRAAYGLIQGVTFTGTHTIIDGNQPPADNARLLAAVIRDEALSVGVGQTYPTITQAYADARAGDTIVIHEGTYTNFPALNGINTGMDNITFQRYGSDKVVIALDSHIYLRYRSGVKFNGLIFNGQGAAAYCIYIRDRGHNTEFRDCVFINPAKTGIYVYGGTWIAGTKMYNCTFYDCAIGYRQANSIGTVTGSIMSNSLFVNNDNAIQVSGALSPVYCAFWNNTTLISAGYSLGSDCVTNVEPVFAGTDLISPNFMYLSHRCPLDIAEGGSGGQAIGARPALPFIGSVIMVN